jgi:phage terminase small subunit
MVTRTKPQSDRPLSTKERVFVEKYMEFGGGKGAGKPAALAAGFRESYAQFAAHRMLRRPIVARVIEERQKTRLRVLVPKAVDTIEEILDDKDHKDRLKAANQVLNRVDPVVVGVAHQHDVRVSVSDDEMALRVLRWLREMGASREMLERSLGVNDLPRLEQLAARQRPGIRARRTGDDRGRSCFRS